MAETVRHRILLIEPSAIVARGIREILSRYPEFEVIVEKTVENTGRRSPGPLF